MRFVAIAVETANADMSSICSIGAAAFEGTRLVSEWYTLIDPRDDFDPLNISIHGINERMVAGAPTYREIAGTLYEMLRDTVAVTHTHFDRIATYQASRRWSTPEPCCLWLDSARVARRAWKECQKSGYGLRDLCEMMGYKFQHHHALEDAKAAGYILLAAMVECRLDLNGWLRRVELPLDMESQNSRAALERAGNPEGPLYGEVIVFTGKISISKLQAAELAASAGCKVSYGVTKETTIVVVGDVDVHRLGAYSKTAKHRRAEQLVNEGLPVRIIRESDFRELIAIASESVPKMAIST